MSMGRYKEGALNKILELFTDLDGERRYDVFVLMAAAMFPIHRSFTSVVILAVFGLVSIIMFGKRYVDKGPVVIRTRYFLISTAYFLVAVLSLSYSRDFKVGLDFVVANSYLLFYPLFIFFFSRRFSERHISLVIFSFILACLLLTGFLHWKFYISGLYTDVGQRNYSIFPFRNVLLENRFHPTYVSMWLLFAALYLIHFVLVRRNGLIWTVLLAACTCLFVFTSILMSVKITTVGFMLGILALVYRMVKNKAVVVGVSGALLILFTIAITQISFLRARFIDEFVETKMEAPVGLATNSLNIRVGIYQCSWKVFRDNWLVGTGIGDAQHELNACYDGFNTDAYREGNYNTHNNYLGIAVATGVIGLVLFVLMFGFHFKHAVVNDNIVFVMFLILVVVSLLGENILSRHQGVVFYSLFCSLFASQNIQLEK